MTDWTWGTVTALGPLRVTLDGDTSALPFTPDALTDPLLLAVGMRVRCELSGRRVVVHGGVWASPYASGWGAVPYASGWATGSGWSGLTARRVPGEIRLSSAFVVRSGSDLAMSTNSEYTIGTLPVDLRPSGARSGICHVAAAGFLGAGILRVNADGTVVVVSPLNATMSASAPGYSNHVVVPGQGIAL